MPNLDIMSEATSAKEPFHRRTYERSLSSLKMPSHYYGFTNRILEQADKDTVNLFVPIYAILKIKSLQKVDVQNLTGNINAVIIINVSIEGLPEPLVYLLTHSIELQVNRSELMFLRESREENISVTRGKGMLKFTIRKTLPAIIYEETLWSPFEIIRLVVSFTFNSISNRSGTDILAQYLEHQQKLNKSKEIAESLVKNMWTSLGSIEGEKRGRPEDKISFNEFRKYSISFNCMRNGLETPISYSLGCVYSLYDLAETGLEVYHTKLDSYTEVIEKYKANLQPPATAQEQKASPAKTEQNKELQLKEYGPSNLEMTEEESCKELMQLSQQVLRGMEGQQVKGKAKTPKPKYSQYSHFVIPLYKYPGNSLATIFIPVFLLSLLSLAIFFQENALSNRISSIATMVLGYIALIPSVKEQLPPSSRITVIEIVIYISTLCCIFSLVESFLIDDYVGYVFNWAENSLFLLCLFIHVGVFLFVVSLMFLHKLAWEPSYNKEVEAHLTDPVNNPEEWINFYCDEEFYKVNHKIHTFNQKNKDKPLKMIAKYTPKREIVEEKREEKREEKKEGKREEKKEGKREEKKEGKREEKKEGKKEMGTGCEQLVQIKQEQAGVATGIEALLQIKPTSSILQPENNNDSTLPHKKKNKKNKNKKRELEKAEEEEKERIVEKDESKDESKGKVVKIVEKDESKGKSGDKFGYITRLKQLDMLISEGKHISIGKGSPSKAVEKGSPLLAVEKEGGRKSKKD